MAEHKPDLPARNFNALFTPLENLLQTWHIEPIGSAWEQVSFNPQVHQPDAEDMLRVSQSMFALLAIPGRSHPQPCEGQPNVARRGGEEVLSFEFRVRNCLPV
jgi:hypothetical protein